MEIIQLDVSNIEKIQELAVNSWNQTYSEILSKPQLEFMLSHIYSLDSLKSQMNQGHDFFGFRIDNNLVGFGSVTIENQFTTKINKLYLLKEFQGNGRGTQIIIFFEKLAIENQTNNLILNVNRNNSAVDFYLKKGFKILEEIDIKFGEYWLNDYIMKKEL